MKFKIHILSKLYATVQSEKANINIAIVPRMTNFFFTLNLIFLDYMEKNNWTYSGVGIWNSGYLAERNSDILWSVMTSDEQMYLPLAVGHSRRKIFALARSSTWTIDVFKRSLYRSLSPSKIYQLWIKT